MVRLLRIKRQELTVRGKRHAVDFSFGAASVEMHVLMNVSQLRPEPADRPLQRPVRCDATALMREVPGLRIPVLKLSVPQPRSLSDQQFDRPDMQPGIACG